MKLIIGLGNPGKDYQNTRHNVGFLVLDAYLNTSDWKEKFNALYHEARINGEKVIFVKPLTYMNLSGDAVVKYVNYYDVNIEDILVIIDSEDSAILSSKYIKFLFIVSELAKAPYSILIRAIILTSFNYYYVINFINFCQHYTQLFF